MIKPILVIFLISLIAFNVQTSFGYEATFEEWGTRIQAIPTVCILEPNYEGDKYLTEKFAERMMEQTSIAIDEWKAQLQLAERSKNIAMWEINQMSIPFEEQKEFDYQDCNIFIHFRDKPELEEDSFKVLGKTKYEQGDTGRSEITVYYAGIEMCRTEDSKFVYFDPCFTDSPRLVPQISSVVKHEFGHALGLGHYVADDLQLNVDWARGDVPSPSIMAVFTHQNYNENRITIDDIKKVRDLYGENGFLHSIIKEVPTFDSFESSLTEYVILEGKSMIGSLQGVVNKKMLVNGILVEIEIALPDETIRKIFATTNSTGFFSVKRLMDYNVPEGTYFATASYRNTQSDEITFEIIKEKAETVVEIPQWVKNNAKWYGEGQTNDRDFILGVEYLLEKEFMEIQDIPEQRKSHEPMVPDWLRNNAKWWSEGLISDEEYINGIQYLIGNGLLRHNFSQ